MADGGSVLPKTTPPFFIPKPDSPARNLLAGGEAADSSRDQAALWNDNFFGDFKLPDHGYNLLRNGRYNVCGSHNPI
jgi:hypothetical protein